MVDEGIGGYFISDTDDEAFEDDDLLSAPVIIPVTPQRAPQPPFAEAVPAIPRAGEEVPAQPPASAAVPAASPGPEASAYTPVESSQAQSAPSQPTREELLGQALDRLMHEDADIQATALVSLDGFTMASALPAGMEADRVGAMSAAILGLGERAATELGRGHLSQVFIEGDNGYVLLMAAGDRAVLTALADPAAKLGLVLYDMKSTAQRIGQILG